MRQADKNVALELAAFLQSHNCCSTEEIISGSEALKKIIAEYKSRLSRAKMVVSKKKYSDILTFLQTFGKGDTAQKKRLYSFCSDITRSHSTPNDMMLVSFHGGDNDKEFKFNERELVKYIEQAKHGQTFNDTVNNFMIKKGLSPKDVYINAKLSRQDFSRITTPSKGVKRSTVFSVAIGLKLTWVETQVLLRSAGYAFRDNSEFDMILMYCISKKMYDVQTINELLYEYGQDTLADNYSKVNNKGFK